MGFVTVARSVENNVRLTNAAQFEDILCKSDSVHERSQMAPHMNDYIH